MPEILRRRIENLKAAFGEFGEHQSRLQANELKKLRDLEAAIIEVDAVVSGAEFFQAAAGLDEFAALVLSVDECRKCEFSDEVLPKYIESCPAVKTGAVLRSALALVLAMEKATAGQSPSAGSFDFRQLVHKALDLPGRRNEKPRVRPSMGGSSFNEGFCL